jgi:hypothetical protein
VQVVGHVSGVINLSSIPLANVEGSQLEWGPTVRAL